MSNALYLEVDEDITSAVEKLIASESADVQVVVPKRSTLLASMINLKLLKKAADQHKKNLVLVTTDRLSTHLAGRAGIAVAAKLGAEASVPEAKVNEPDASDVIDGGTEETGPETAEAATALGAAAVVGAAAGERESEAAAVAKGASDEMPIPGAKADAPESDEPVMKTKELSDKPPASGKDKSKSKNRVPDFNALQKRVLWAGLALGLILTWFIVNFFWAHATVVIYAKGSNVPASASFVADPAAASSNVEGGTLKAQDLSSTKDLSEQVNATGTQDVGTKASGTMTISNSYDSNSRTIPAGTKFTAQGKSFSSGAAVTVPGAGVSGGHVVPGSASVAVTADAAGDSYNLAPTSYTVSGQPSQVTGSGGQMSGGTTKTVTVVQQSDIDGAVSSLLDKDKAGAQQALADHADKGNQMISETFTQTSANVTSDQPVGTQTDKLTVKVTANYDALAISSADLDALLKANIAKQVGPSNQVYETGASSATFKVIKKDPSGSQSLSVNSTGSAGPKLDTEAIAKEIKGKKYGDATDTLNNMAGVEHATITITPSWHTSLPSRASKIKIQIKVASG